MISVGPIPFALVVLAFAWGCDGEVTPEQPTHKSAGFLELAVGSDVRKIPYASATCSDQSDHLLIELSGTMPLAHNAGTATPRILIARIRGDELLEAHAFATHVQFGNHDYEILQMSGGDCRVESTGEQHTVTCNEAAVVGWLEDGPIPLPSYRVAFRCAD